MRAKHNSLIRVDENTLLARDCSDSSQTQMIDELWNKILANYCPNLNT